MKKTTEDFCETAKRVLERLTEIVTDKDYDGSQGRRFLTLFFAEDRALFHKFMGFLKAELKMTSRNPPWWISWQRPRWPPLPWAGTKAIPKRAGFSMRTQGGEHELSLKPCHW